MQRKIYLEDIPLDEAWAAFRAALDEADLWRPLDPETVPLSRANGRVTAAAVWARLSSPPYHAAAMDGYVVRAEDTLGATEGTPLTFALVEEQGSGVIVLPCSPAPPHSERCFALNPSTQAIPFPSGRAPSS